MAKTELKITKKELQKIVYDVLSSEEVISNTDYGRKKLTAKLCEEIIDLVPESGINFHITIGEKL